MNDFMDKIQSTLLNEGNVSMTENGALGFRTSGKELSDLHFAVSSLRNQAVEVVARRFARAYYEDKALAVKWLFYAGDVREGLGERRLFRIGLVFLALVEPNAIRRLMPLIPEYTRWDALVSLFDTPLESDALQIIGKQLESDLGALESNKPVSLAAKWLPSENASSPQTAQAAKYLADKLGMTRKEYRTVLSKLRRRLDVVEVRMSRNDWAGIDYKAVPSRANLLYNKAFIKHDNARRVGYLEAVKRGEQKINAAVLFPHDIAHRYLSGNVGVYSRHVGQKDDALEALWKALPDYVQGDASTMCVVDGSGSMRTSVGRTRITALEVAFSLGIYFAERCHEQFKDRFITFSEHPQFVDMRDCTTLHDKLYKALGYSEIANTNIEAVFDLILQTAVKHKMNQRDLPQNILILSDMEFDSCATVGESKPDARLFEQIADRYAQHGYKLPRLIFWNICGRTGTIPVRENELGVALVSGFSPAVVSSVLGGELDPYKLLINVLNGDRYKPITIDI